MRRYSEARFSIFFEMGRFWAKNPKTDPKVAFPSKWSDFQVQYVIRSALTHRIWIFYQILKIWKIADFREKNLAGKFFLGHKKEIAAFPSKWADLQVQYVFRSVLTHRFRIFWPIWKILKIADFTEKSLARLFYTKTRFWYLSQNSQIFNCYAALNAYWTRDYKSFNLF